MTPDDYEPPFFRPGTADEKFTFPVNPEKIHMGQVDTPFHSLGMEIKTAADAIFHEQIYSVNDHVVVDSNLQQQHIERYQNIFSHGAVPQHRVFNSETDHAIAAIDKDHNNAPEDDKMYI